MPPFCIEHSYYIGIRGPGYQWNIHNLAKRGKLTGVKLYLLFHPEDVNRINYAGASPLYIAAEKGDFRMAKYLLKKGGGVGESQNRILTAILYAKGVGREEHIKMAAYYIETWMNVETIKSTPVLHSACRRCYPEIVELLVAKGADINAKSWYYEETPLMASVKCEKITSYLIEKGADVNVRD